MQATNVRVFSRGWERVGLGRVGGLLAIGGRPLGGKNVLAARLVECLPYATKLETADNLERDQEYLPTKKAKPRAAASPQRELLEKARALLRGGSPWSTPIVVLSCRFATAESRLAAQAIARTAGVPFLFIEARSRDIRALRRIPMSFLSAEELKRRTARYERACAEYQPVTAAEMRTLPGIRVTKVLSELDAAVERVLAAWRQR